jgi:hypothetical protein
MTAHATITHHDSILVEDHVGTKLQPEHAALRPRVERLLREIFEGHEEFLGVTPD